MTVGVLVDALDWLTSTLGPIAGTWGYPIVFAAAAAEASLMLGLVLPGETVLLVVGYLAWRGHGALVLFVASAALGAASGDFLGYVLGRRFGSDVRASWLGRKVGDRRWERAERYLRARGGRAVFLARFVTGPKAVVPFLAGQADMRLPTFVEWNLAGAVLWGTFHVGLGYVAGPSIEAMDRWVGRVGWALLGAAVLGVVVWSLVRRRREA